MHNPSSVNIRHRPQRGLRSNSVFRTERIRNVVIAENETMVNIQDVFLLFLPMSSKGWGLKCWNCSDESFLGLSSVVCAVLSLACTADIRYTVQYYSTYAYRGEAAPKPSKPSMYSTGAPTTQHSATIIAAAPTLKFLTT